MNLTIVRLFARIAYRVGYLREVWMLAYEEGRCARDGEDETAGSANSPFHGKGNVVRLSRKRI